MDEIRTGNSQNQDAGGIEINFIGALIVIARHRKAILFFPLAVAIAAVVISLLLPDVFKATTKLLPPQQNQSSAAALLSQLSGGAGVPGVKNANDLYVGVLRSRTIADRLIARFDLKKIYGVDSMEKARRQLEDNTGIVAGKDGLLTVEVEDEDRRLVARIANAYVEEFLDVTRVLALTEASQRRLFFEKQLELAKDNLAKSEMELKGGLDTRGVISVDSDSRAMVEMVSRLRAQISAKLIQLNSMQAFVTPSNPEYKRAQEELASLRSELSKLENGRDAGPATTAPAKQEGLGNIKLLRDVKYYQMLYELLAKQYEMARLDEAKQAPVIQVLDPALEPERKFKPKRAIIVVVSTLLAFFLSLAYAFISELKREALALPENARRWAQLRADVRKI